MAWLQDAWLKLKAETALNEMTVMHLIENTDPCRIRLLWPRLKHDADTRASLEEALSSLKAVRSFSINPVTGSVTVYYALSALDPASLPGLMLKKARERYLAQGH